MKFLSKTRVLFLIQIVLTALLSGCGNDGVQPAAQNSITLNGQAFQISTASILGVSIGGTGHAGITFTQGTQTNSKVLTLDIAYSGNSHIAGTYAFPQGTSLFLDDILSTYVEMTVTGGNINSTSTNLAAGTVTITENGGSNYTVDMDVTMVDGKKFKGTYKGNFIASFSNN